MIDVEQGMKVEAFLFAAGVWALLACSYAGSANGMESAVKAVSKSDLIATSDILHKQMVPGGRYEFVTPAERKVVDDKLGEMQALFEKYGSVTDMGKDSKIELFNDQEAVNAILTNRDGDRRICKSVAPTGSLLPKTSCHTYGELERSRRDSQEFMRQNMQVPQQKSGG